METLANPAQPAATLVLIRDSIDGLEVFMVTRQQRIDAFTGALVFPGGKVDGSDRATEVIEYCRGGAALDDLPLRIAAIREAFEETGLLLAYPGASLNLLNHDQAQALNPYRQALRANRLGMAQFCRTAGLQLAIDRLQAFAHWITPATQPRRFDTYFYLASGPGQTPAIDANDAEVRDALWIAPRRALADAEQGRRILVFPTRLNLLKLARAATAAQALATARHESIVTVQPEIESHPDGTIMAIPGAAGYGASRFLISRDARTLTPLD